MNLIFNNSPKLVHFHFHLLYLILFVICNLTNAYPVMQDTGEVYPEVESKLDIRNMFQEVNHHNRKKVRSRGVPNVEHPGIDPEPLPSTDQTVLERNMDSIAQEKHSKFGWMSKRSFYTIGGYGLLTIILCVIGFLLIRYSRKGTNSSDTAEQSKTSGKDLKDPNNSDSEGSESGGRYRKGRKGGYKKAEQINQQNRRLRDSDPRDRRHTKNNKDNRNGQSSDSEAPLSSSSSSSGSSSSVERKLPTKSNNKRNKRQKKNKPHNRGPKDLAGLVTLTGSRVSGSSLDEDEPCSMRNRERRKNRNKHFKDYQKYAIEPRQPQPTSILSRSETELTGQSLLRSSSSSSNDGSQMLKANQRASESDKKLPIKDQGKAKPPTLTTLTTSTNPYDLSSTQQSSWLESSEPESKTKNTKNLTYGANSVFNLDKKGNLVVKNMRLNRNQQLHTELVNRQANRAQATNKSSRFSGSLTRTSSSELLSSQQHQSIGSNTTSTSSPNSVNFSKILLQNPALAKHNKAAKNGPKVMVPAVPNCLDTDLVKSSLINEMSSSVLFESETCRSLNRTVSSIDFDTRTNQVSTQQPQKPSQQKNAEPSQDSRRNLLNEILCYQSRTAKKRKANRPLFTLNESNTESAVIYDVVQKQGQIAAAASAARTVTAQAGPEAVPIAPKQVKNCTGETMINANFVRDNKRKVRSARRKKILKSILRNSKSSIDAWSLMDEDDADGDNDNKDEDDDDLLDQDSDLRDDSERLGSKNNDSSDRPNSRKQVSFSRDICSVRYIK